MFPSLRLTTPNLLGSHADHQCDEHGGGYHTGRRGICGQNRERVIAHRRHPEQYSSGTDAHSEP
jgi:hypothetical protein